MSGEHDRETEPEPAPEGGHFILYVFGAVSLSLGAYFAAGAVQDGAWEGEGSWALGVGAVAVSLGAWLHDRERRRWPEPPAGEGSNGIWWLRVGAGLLLLPLLAAWVQFELFMDPIQMFPFTTLIGAVATSYALVRVALPVGRARCVLGPTIAASVGVPGALLVHALLVAHFTHHLSNVAVWVLPGGRYSEDRPTLVGADLPQMESEMELPTASLELLAQLEAEPLDPSEYRIDADGSLLRIEPDGTEVPVETLTAAEFGAIFDEAQRQDEADAREARASRRAAYAAQVEALRRGGRIFR